MKFPLTPDTTLSFMNHFGEKSFSAMLEMAAFSGTEIHVSVADSTNATTRFKSHVADVTGENILLHPPAGANDSDLRKLLHKQITIRIPHNGGMCAWTSAATALYRHKNITCLVCSNPGGCSYTNNRKHTRLPLSSSEKNIEALIIERSGQKKTIACTTIFDISSIAAAVSLSRADVTTVTEVTDAHLIVKQSGKKVFEAPVSKTVFQRNQNTGPGTSRRILFFTPARRSTTYRRGIRRIAPPEKWPVFIQAHHPLLPETILQGRMVNFSRTGILFSTHGNAGEIFPGLVLNNLKLFFPFCKTLAADATVVHSTPITDGSEGELHVGLSIQHLSDKYNSVSDGLFLRDIDSTLCEASDTDIHEIFRHLFFSNFIYRQKRRFLQHHADAVYATQIKLLKPNTVAKTIVSREGDSIRGFIQYLKFHPHTWLVQHLAGSAGYKRETGRLTVKATIDYFLHPEINRKRKVRYVTCYFRPNNPYPMLLFNDFSQQLGNPAISNCITYTYCTTETSVDDNQRHDNYRCSIATGADLAHLDSFITTTYGKTYRDIEALGKKELATDRLSREYGRYGLLRQRKVICLKNADDIPLAYSVSELSSPGMNLSELTNSFKIYTLANIDVSVREALETLTAATISEYRKSGITSPVLLALTTSPIPNPFKKTKQYVFWYLDADYFGALNTYFNTVTGNMKQHLRQFKERLTMRHEQQQQ